MGYSLLLLLLLSCFGSIAADTSFNFTKNSHSGFENYGDASINTNSDSVDADLTLTKYLEQPVNSVGRFMFKDPIRLKDATGAMASFNTFFVFSIVQYLENKPPFRPGAGLGFILVPAKYRDVPEGSFGEYIGVLNATMQGNPDSHTIAVEFDNVQNADFGDPPQNHVGVNVNSMNSTKTYLIETDYLNITRNYTLAAWIDYDAKKHILEVRMAHSNDSRPSIPIIQTQLNLTDVVEDVMFAGFSAGTGQDCYEFHKIIAWNFSTSGIDDDNCTGLTCSRGAIAAVSVAGAAGFLIVALAIWYTVCRRDGADEDLSGVFSTTSVTRFAYKELKSATRGFNKKEILGTGGFSKVYRGTFGNGSMVAVKYLVRRDLAENEEDKSVEQFVAEMAIIGRLRHRNLVGLKGFCKERKKLLLVYDFMPNGSLDKLLFSKVGPALPWDKRLHIIRGVAEGLAFLHEGWEQRVVHRDVKAANVLLDDNWNAKLGDFGFAKLMEHGDTSLTMTRVGTTGYIAPELVYIGKANEKTDVYSYGILVLEVVTGRRAIQRQPSAEYACQLDWVWKMREEDRLLEVVDTQMPFAYEEEVVLRALCLGLSCCHPDPCSRPTMRRCCQILEATAASVYDFPTSRPVPVYSSASFSALMSSSGSSAFSHSPNSKPLLAQP